MAQPTLSLVLALGLPLLAAAQQCASCNAATDKYSYGNVFADLRDSSIQFEDLPGFTRSVYARDHALITPESRVFAGMPNWKNAVTAHLISPATGAHFSMYLARLQADAAAPAPAPGVERFVFVVEGGVRIAKDGANVDLASNHFAYFPPNATLGFTSETGAGVLVFERIFALAKAAPQFQHGCVEDQPLLPPGGREIFGLRKLLPQTTDYDFNVHVMDFKPGESLYIKEVHYNQHGLLLLQGQGIYRLGDSWYPVQAGDAIWMPPYVPQWYAALGKVNSRYILYKDTILDPLLTLAS